MNRTARAAAIVALVCTIWPGAAAADEAMENPGNPQFASAAAGAGNAASALLLLEVIVNGRDSGKTGEFVQRNGALFIRTAELEELGFRKPEMVVPGSDGLVSLSAIPGFEYRLDGLAQAIVVTAANNLLLPVLLYAGARSGPAVPVESRIGATFNYDLIGSRSGNQNAISGQFDLRGFSPWGVASSGLIVYPRYAGATPIYQAVRLDSTWSLSDPDSLRRYRLGDVITGGLGWSRPVRLGGAQFSVDFSLRPDLVTAPLPVVSGTAAVPSTVDVLVNGSRVLSGEAAQGPFVIPQLPAVSGASSVTLAVTDALGRQVVTTVPFYTGGGLLAQGLQSFSFEAGAVRLNYGLVSNDYDSAAASGTWRRGLSNFFTLEAHAEAMPDLFMGGAGGVLNVANLGVVNFGIAGSAASGHGGMLVQIGAARLAHPFSFAVNATFAQRNFSDIAARNFDPVPARQLNAGMGVELGKFGSLGLAFNSIDRPSTLVPAMPGSFGITPSTNPGFFETAQHARLLSASYSIQLGPMSFYANCFHDLAVRSTGVAVGLTIPLGARSSAAAGGAFGSGGTYGQFQSNQAANEETSGDFGYQLYAAQGSQSHQFADVQYKSPWALLSAGADRFDGQTAFRVEAQGALSAAGGGVFPSPPVSDAFAVVDTGGIPNVHVLRENRLVGQTDSAGRIFIPDLRAFDINHLTIDPNDVPADADLQTASRDVRPQDHSGVVVSFPIRRTQSALLRLVDESGSAIPLGSSAVLRRTGVNVPVGYDGEAYIEDLAPHNEVAVDEPDGTRCIAVFDYRAEPGEIATIGPLICREDMQ